LAPSKISKLREHWIISICHLQRRSTLSQWIGGIKVLLTKHHPKELDRAKKKVRVRRVPRFIANHHFHPAIIQEMVNEERVNIDFIDRELIKATGLLGNGYTEEDRFQGKVGNEEVDVYVAVPSYSYEEAARDYELASARYRLNAIIKSCTGKYRGETFLTKGDAKNQTSKDPPQPVGKQRKLDSNDPKDLQRAVCLLSDRVSELEQRVKLLHNELMWERFQRRRSTLMLRASLYSSEYDGGMT
jgi:3-hydroxyacyl-CoA dehydrogenase